MKMHSNNQTCDRYFKLAYVITLVAIVDKIVFGSGSLLFIFVLIFLIGGYGKALFCKGDSYINVYICLLVLGSIGHFLLGATIDDVFKKSLPFITAMVLLLSYRYNKKSSHLLLLMLSLFFFVECTLSIYERATLTNVIQFPDNDLWDFGADSYENASDFRSRALLNHPLTNANVLSIFMGFIFISKTLNNKCKFFLMMLGIGGLWGFNSRASLVVWIFILFVDRFFSKKKIIIASFILVMLLISKEAILNIVNNMEFLGRLNFDFSDGSSSTRISAFYTFAVQDWDLYSILFGGKLIRMPRSDLLIENGILLSLGYWGWILGTAKILLELLISYRCVRLYPVKSQIIILTSVWGVALFNNNIFGPFVLIFFTLAYIVFCSAEKNRPVRLKK